MTLEDFKDVYKDKTPVEKLKLMQVQHGYWRNDMKDRIDANWRGNFEEAQYYARECDAMRDRIIWLHEGISKVLKVHEPVKPVTSEVQYGDHLQHCPSCGNALPNRGEYGISHYCYKCGQAVKWE